MAFPGVAGTREIDGPHEGLFPFTMRERVVAAGNESALC